MSYNASRRGGESNIVILMLYGGQETWLHIKFAFMLTKIQVANRFKKQVFVANPNNLCFRGYIFYMTLHMRDGG